jgi:hypothetical protein
VVISASLNSDVSIYSGIRRNQLMKTRSKVVGGLGVMLALAVASSSMAQEKAEEKKAEKAEKAKAEKVSGDIGLLDTEKNYMIVVTKDGKLVTVDYTQKTKVTELKEKPAKMSDIGLGSAAAAEYTQKGDKNFLSKIEFTPAKGGD